MYIKPKVVAIVGPTASGKTALSLLLAKQFNGEIISADSRAIYRGLDIGSAKPSLAERQAIPHHLLDIVKPNQVLTLSEYKVLAVQAITDISSRGKLPILVGGTALYIYAVLDNWQIPTVPANPSLRAELEKKTVSELYNMLMKTDPEAKEFIDPQNKRRIIRALEVVGMTGTKFSEQRQTGPVLFDSLILGVKKDEAEIKQAIATRTEVMLQAGLVAEVKGLLATGYSPALPALSGIHYKEIIAHLNGEYDLAEAVRLMNQNSWQLTKRQLTWFKRDERIQWVQDSAEAEKLLQIFLQ